jgi:YesN/AraC family two-component response regulator
MEPLSHDYADLSILCVEDDPDTRDFLREIIKSRFHHITLHLAENGYVGLGLFKDHAPHLTITDVCMPVMDGIRMAKEIRKLEPDARIIVLTAYVDTCYLLDAIRLGISNYLLKPIDPELLCKAIHDIVGKFDLECKAGEEVVKSDSAGHAFDQLGGYNSEEAPGQSRQRLNAQMAVNRDFAAYCYRLAHDLRSPLNGINITTEALITLFGDQFNAECKTFIGYIQEEVQRMNRLIDGVMRYSEHSKREEAASHVRDLEK